MRASPSNARGSALIVAIIFLLLLATLALSGLRSSTSNVQVAGNMQARQEATAAAQMLIERIVSTDEFARNPTGVYEGAEVRADYNGDGEPDAIARLTQPPVCLRARTVPLVDLDPANTMDAPCFASASLANSGLITAGGAPAGSLCADTEWELSSEATDARTGARVTLNQGVTLRAAVVGLNEICK